MAPWLVVVVGLAAALVATIVTATLFLVLDDDGEPGASRVAVIFDAGLVPPDAPRSRASTGG